MAIQLEIMVTTKSFSPAADWYRGGTSRHTFSTLAEADAFLKERYGTCKRVPMMLDKPDGGVMQTGWVYGFRSADLSHYPVTRWLQQDWVSFFEIRALELTPRSKEKAA